ncbi:hypothetical protein WKH57_15275 [Niallia taxi]
MEKTSLSEILGSYIDLCNEIEYWETMKRGREIEWKINRKLMFKNPSPNGGGYIPVPMDIAAGNLDKIKDHHDNIERILRIKKRMKRQAEVVLSRFEGVEYKVAYARFVERKLLREIAIELNYSYDRIRHIMSKINKEISED